MRRKVGYFILTCLFWWSEEGGVTALGQSDRLKSFLSHLPQVEKISSIEIQDDWMGLSELGPLGKRYILKPGVQQFTGTAIFTLGAGPRQRAKEEPVSVPNEVIQSFLSLLSQSPFEKGEYKPNITHTDDYPSRRIEIVSEGGKLILFSTSQGEFAIPWGASFEDEHDIVNSKNPGEALIKIQPYLKNEVFKKFEQEVLVQTRKTKK